MLPDEPTLGPCQEGNESWTRTGLLSSLEGLGWVFGLELSGKINPVISLDAALMDYL